MQSLHWKHAQANLEEQNTCKLAACCRPVSIRSDSGSFVASDLACCYDQEEGGCPFDPSASASAAPSRWGGRWPPPASQQLLAWGCQGWAWVGALGSRLQSPSTAAVAPLHVRTSETKFQTAAKSWSVLHECKEGSLSPPIYSGQTKRMKVSPCRHAKGDKCNNTANCLLTRLYKGHMMHVGNSPPAVSNSTASILNSAINLSGQLLTHRSQACLPQL